MFMAWCVDCFVNFFHNGQMYGSFYSFRAERSAQSDGFCFPGRCGVIASTFLVEAEWQLTLSVSPVVGVNAERYVDSMSIENTRRTKIRVVHFDAEWYLPRSGRRRAKSAAIWDSAEGHRPLSGATQSDFCRYPGWHRFTSTVVWV